MFPLSRLYVNRILYVWEYIFLQSEAFGSLLYFTAVYTWGHVFRHLLLIFLPLWNQFKFSSKAIWGLTWGAQYPFPRKNTDFWKESKITLWKSHVPTLFWLINFLWVIPQWSESSTCLQIGFDFLSWVWFFVCFLCCLESFPQSLDFDTMQADVQLLLLRCFFFSSLGSPELNGSCTIYFMPYCSCYHFAPKMFSSYLITSSLRLTVCWHTIHSCVSLT